MEIEKNYQEDIDYKKSLEDEIQKVTRLNKLDIEFAREIFEKALYDKFDEVSTHQDHLQKKVKIIRICEEIGFENVAKNLLMKANEGID